MNLTVIQVSTRPGRASEPIAKWFIERAKSHGAFEVVFVDLREVALPLFDEPKHPRFQQYEHEHTKRWSAIVAAADAFVFVTPEYNFGAPPSLVNALDFVYREWNYKPAAFVSYGGPAAGVRSAAMAKQILTTLKVVPMMESVAIPLFTTMIENDVFRPNEPLEKSVKPMLDELHKWAVALKTMR